MKRFLKFFWIEVKKVVLGIAVTMLVLGSGLGLLFMLSAFIGVSGLLALVLLVIVFAPAAIIAAEKAEKEEDK